VKFEDQRTRPARDLIAQVPLETVARGVDLGCGPGNSTKLLIERWGAAGISGLDSDADMVEAARKRLPGTAFSLADLATWQPSEPQDLLFANAVFQWLPNHLDIFERLMDALVPGGVLAVQMPDNRNEPSHLLMEEAAHAGPWRDAFLRNPARRAEMPTTADYYNRLIGRSARLDIWHTIYNHPMDGAAAIVEWVKGTGLMPYLERVAAGEREHYIDDYRARLEKAYPAMADGKVLFRFPRIFIVAVKA
jgi:trans-aconitate 2-methyltransferase